MRFTHCIRVLALAFIAMQSTYAFAGTAGSISGNVTDGQGIAIPNASVKVLTPVGAPVKETTTNTTGDYSVFPIDFGDYTVSIQANGFAKYEISVHVSSDSVTQANAQLAPPAQTGEMVVKVQAKKKLVQSTASVSSKDISSEQIEKLPGGDNITLPKLITSTTPGVIQGSFGQMFFRGNHANIQYQIDGVQLPDSPSGTFGEAFSPRNIDHMEIITGGIPAEYGERLGAVVNIITKTGAETPGGSLDLNYGSFDTFQPFGLFSGSNAAGDVHYFVSAQYKTTSRGLDTPQPVSDADLNHGGSDVVHDNSNGNNEFAKIDWLMDNENKFTFVLFNSYNFFQIPNFPASFAPTDPLFNTGDSLGNIPYNYVPPGTDDNEYEDNAYVEAVWKHTFSEHSFLQVAPYYKYSYINFNNDPANDLFEALGNGVTGPEPVTNAVGSSFNENRHVNNLGLKTDFSDRINDLNLVKAGFQLQASQSAGYATVLAAGSNASPPPIVASTSSTDNGTVNSYFEAVYLQDDFTIAKPLVLNVGVRYDATQFVFPDLESDDGLVQPRIGLNWMITDSTKFHIFYGKLFQPAPAENLRDAFIASSSVATTACPAGQLCPFDIKAEKDDYEEVGVSQQWLNHLFTLNAYYKDAVNQLDDAQLLNTPIAQPYNYDHGFAYGVEFSVAGKINDDWSDYANYSYDMAQGEGISGGIFAFTAGNAPTPDYQFLDHVQQHTANAGVTYAKDSYYWTTQALFGSGLRTGPGNSLSCPSHFTMDTTIGYNFAGSSWLSKFKLSADVLNIFDYSYPITIANGFNGSHYAAGRQLFVHLTKEL